ncbi:putative alkaline serine protease AorO [Amylocarpus encephaloides]|uniref:tripeptidyl-peptidase II n=1 Tax=Amylocarpus encephaloides TaxID=45428 RepID=A0A9P8C5I3_9HELO|nr:putative alkaline serine protease AorO [Amylocarpus encephaloides]
MHFSQFGFLGALVLQVTAIPQPKNHVVHERRDFTSDTWTKRDRLHSSTIVPVRVGMSQRNLDIAHELLMKVSSHDSPRYGKHYTPEEIVDLFAPSKTTSDAIIDWLVSEGIEADSISQSANKQWMQFDTEACTLESLLKTEYHVYEHAHNGKATIACDEYHVPSNIQEHVDYITPGIKIHSPGDRRSDDSTLGKRIFGVTGAKGNAALQPPKIRPMPTFNPLITGCDTIVTPACVMALYNITTPSKASATNKLGIFEALGDVYDQADLDSFYAKYATNIPKGTKPLLNAVDGGVAPVAISAAGAESILDFQIAYPIIYPQGTVLYQTDDPVYENNYVFSGFLNTFLDALDGSYCSTIDPLDPKYPNPSTKAGAFKGALQCGVYKPTNVISISYGGDEAGLPVAYQRRQCNEFLKLGMQGVSVLVASGDSGVEGQQCLGRQGKVFSPDFPASCPYLTAVGGTTLPVGAQAEIDAEVAVTRFPSGGGFSNIYEIPSYQASAVAGYLKNSPPTYKAYQTVNATRIGANSGIYNSAGRAYPDVSAVGDNVAIVYKGTASLIGGTSASAPAFAAILTRINEERIAAGRSTVGFVNPALYANPQVLHDITTGTNAGCGTKGFSAAKGWDPVTGLGTPNYPAMLSLFMGL